MSIQTIESLLRQEDPTRPQQIGFLLLNEFSLLAFASAIEPLRAANRQSGRPIFEWMVASPNGISSIASNGVEVHTNTDPENLQK